MKYPERQAANTLADAADSRSFNRIIFGNEVLNRTKPQQQAVMDAFLGFVECMCRQYDAGHYDVQNEAAMYAAVWIRETLTNEYGHWPVHLT
jgi:hypothetical protein